MKLPSRFQYALRALVDLALHQGTGPVPVKAIAKRQGIPTRYLEQLFNRLRRQGLVRAERGPRGGFHLAQAPDQISVGFIFRSLELPGSSAPGNSLKGAVPPLDPSSAVWKQVETAVQTTLQATTLGDLVAQAREDTPAFITHRFPFHI